jgi:hypothetical protein
MGADRDTPPPVIVRGEGAAIYDDRGRRYLDGLAGLFVVQAGHGRRVLADAAAKQAAELAFFPLWSYPHPAAIELSQRLAAAAPGDLFLNGRSALARLRGGEPVGSVLARIKEPTPNRPAGRGGHLRKLDPPLPCRPARRPTTCSTRRPGAGPGTARRPG